MSIVFLVLGYIFFMLVVKLNDFRHILMANICSCFFAGIYFILNDAYVGGAVTLIAGMASLGQLLLARYETDSIQKIRNIVALSLSTLVIIILYTKPSDLLPCIAFTTNRLAETRRNAALIHFSTFVTTILWALYAYSNQLYLLTCVELMISTYAFYKVAKHVQKNNLLNQWNIIPKDLTTMLLPSSSKDHHQA